MNIRSNTLIDRWDRPVPFHLNNGLVLRLDGPGPVLEGGAAKYAFSSGIAVQEIFAFLKNLRYGLIGVGPDLYLTQYKTEAPFDLIFKVHGGYITSTHAAEDMLWRSQSIEYCCRWLLSSSNDGPDYLTSSSVETLFDFVQDGQYGLAELEEFIAASSKADLPVKECFFLHNVVACFDDVRSALLRAGHHATSMSRYLWTVNNKQSAQSFPGKKEEGVVEVKHASRTGDHVAEEFTSAIISSYSALDLLLRLFIFLVREPFGDPKLPRGWHFSDIALGRAWKTLKQSKQGDLSGAQVPNAIPFLAGNEFDGLRKLRNELVHNSAADDIRPQIYVGFGTPQVGGLQLQYAQYRTRDIDSNGAPIEHQWCARFYRQDRSADLELHSWLLRVWETVLDTCDWIIQRLKVPNGVSICQVRLDGGGQDSSSVLTGSP